MCWCAVKKLLTHSLTCSLLAGLPGDVWLAESVMTLVQPAVVYFRLSVIWSLVSRLLVIYIVLTVWGFSSCVYEFIRVLFLCYCMVYFMVRSLYFLLIAAEWCFEGASICVLCRRTSQGLQPPRLGQSHYFSGKRYFLQKSAAKNEKKNFFFAFIWIHSVQWDKVPKSGIIFNNNCWVG